MPVDRETIQHFERLGRVIAETRPCEPLPRTIKDVFEQMVAIDARFVKGTKDPLGGDLPSHLAYLEFRQAWLRRTLE